MTLELDLIQKLLDLNRDLSKEFSTIALKNLSETTMFLHSLSIGRLEFFLSLIAKSSLKFKDKTTKTIDLFSLLPINKLKVFLTYQKDFSQA